MSALEWGIFPGIDSTLNTSYRYRVIPSAFNHRTRNTIMKKILILIVGLLASGITMPSTAQASSIRIGHSSIYNSGYHSCGCAIRTKRVVYGFNRYHRPIYRYYSVPTIHRCGHRGHYRSSRYGYRSHYNHRRSSYRGYHGSRHSYNRNSYRRSSRRSSRR